MAALRPLLFELAIRALSVLSVTGQRRIGRWFGRLAWLLDLEIARTTRVNLTHCYPELAAEERRRLARQSLEHTGMLAAELGAVYRWPPARWRRLIVDVQGEADLQAAIGSGRGVLLLVPHFGNWEFLTLTLGPLRPTALYDPPRIAALEPVLRRARDRAGASLLPIDAGGLRGFIRALSGGGTVALLPDQVPPRGAGVYVDFFARPALTMTFVHRLLQRSDPAVFLAAAVRCDGGFRVCYRDLGRALHAPDPQESAAAMNRAIETLVRSDPAQYQWEYKRFKRPPAGEVSIYRASSR